MADMDNVIPIQPSEETSPEEDMVSIFAAMSWLLGHVSGNDGEGDVPPEVWEAFYTCRAIALGMAAPAKPKP